MAIWRAAMVRLDEDPDRLIRDHTAQDEYHDKGY